MRLFSGLNDYFLLYHNHFPAYFPKDYSFQLPGIISLIMRVNLGNVWSKMYIAVFMYVSIANKTEVFTAKAECREAHSL